MEFTVLDEPKWIATREALLKPEIIVASDAKATVIFEFKDEKLEFPKAAFIILTSKFSEFVALCGAKTVLMMYLTRYLAYSSQHATILYHGFLSIIFLMSVFGAIIADSWLGKYKTVLCMFISFAIGMIMLSLGSVPVFELLSREITVVAIILIAIGTGCMKPCFVALGGDQFKLPQHKKQMSQYYSWYYIALKLAFLSASSLTPVLRNDVKCFGMEYCFPLAFGVSGLFVIVAFTIFLSGRQWIVKKLPTDNVFVLVTRCIWTGATHGLTNKRENPKEHWLDHAVPQYGTQIVNDVKIVLNTIVIFLPIPMVWALNEQTGSRWTLQATTLNGDLGFYQLKPDQMTFLLPVMVMLSIALLDIGFDSSLHRVGINSDVRRIVLGAILTGLAFIASGLLELQTMPTLAVKPTIGYCQVRLYNLLPCDLKIISDVPELNNIVIPSLDIYKTDVKVSFFLSVNVSFVTDSKLCSVYQYEMVLEAGKAKSFLFQTNKSSIFVENTLKNDNGLARLRILSNDPTNPSLTLTDINISNYTIPTHSIDSVTVHPGMYRISYNTTVLTTIKLGPGSVTSLLYHYMSPAKIITKSIEISPASSVHILWMIPQYAFVGAGEAILGVAGLRFAYNEAPESMKTVLLSCWLLTISAGNVIALVILSLHNFETEAYVSFLFATLMLVDSVWLMWLIKRYKRLSYERQSN